MKVMKAMKIRNVSVKLEWIVETFQRHIYRSEPPSGGQMCNLLRPHTVITLISHSLVSRKSTPLQHLFVLFPQQICFGN